MTNSTPVSGAVSRFAARKITVPMITANTLANLPGSPTALANVVRIKAPPAAPGIVSTLMSMTPPKSASCPFDTLPILSGQGFQLRSNPGGCYKLRFTVQRGQKVSPSPRSNRLPGGQNIACSVHIGVGAVPASDTTEDRLALAVLLSRMPAGVAASRRERRIDLDQHHASQVTLVSESPAEKAPAAGKNLPVQSRLLTDVAARHLDGPSGGTSHVLHPQRLDGDQIEVDDETGGCLLNPILDSIGFSGPQPGDSEPGPFPTATPLLLPGQLPLETGKAGTFRLGHRRGMDEFAVARRKGIDDPPVDANNRASRGPFNRIRKTGEGDMPASGSVTGHPIRLDLTDRTCPTEPHPSDLRDTHLSPATVEPPDMLGLEADDPEPVVESSLTPGRPAVCPGPPVPHRLSEVAQRLLLNHERSRSEERRVGEEGRSRW